jgi:hypothetical protein
MKDWAFTDGVNPMEWEVCPNACPSVIVNMNVDNTNYNGLAFWCLAVASA